MDRPTIPPPRPSFRPSRNPIVRLILWFTEPSMIKGMALGVILALIVGVAIKLEAMWYIIAALLTVLFVCLFGVLIGHYLFEARRKRVQAKGIEMLREAGSELPALSENLLTMLWSRDRSHLPQVWERIRRIGPAVEEVGGLTIAVVFRTMAMSALFAVLGAAISFAVFLTSFMQVERMTEQNKLIQTQIAQTQKQMEFDENVQNIEIALAIADRRQKALADILADVKIGTCTGEAPTNRQGEKKRCLTDTSARQLTMSFPQLGPYRPILGVENRIADAPTSPEQAALLRWLSASNIDVGHEGLDFARAFLDHAELKETFLDRIRLTDASMRHTQLYDADLAGVDFARSWLNFAVLSRSKMVQGNLASAHLYKTNLAGADLTGANLTKADFTGANLKGAVLQQANLGEAVFHGANMTDANLTGADLTGTDLALANLNTASLPQVPKVRNAAFWWLAVYPPDYAAKLGLDAAAQQRNQAGYDRLVKALATDPALDTLDATSVTAIVEELKAAAPTPPA